jgi:hypothetical protein
VGWLEEEKVRRRKRDRRSCIVCRAARCGGGDSSKKRYSLGFWCFLDLERTKTEETEEMLESKKMEKVNVVNVKMKRKIELVVAKKENQGTLVTGKKTSWLSLRVTNLLWINQLLHAFARLVRFFVPFLSSSGFKKRLLNRYLVELYRKKESTKILLEVEVIHMSTVHTSYLVVGCPAQHPGDAHNMTR